MAGTNVHIAAAVQHPNPGPHPYGPIDPELEEDVSDNESIQNFIEHSWIYSQGTINDMRIYQT
ncbi:MAG: hypothetical protein LUO92_01840, partial [Methanothrix sp.]|nr:hypothetical protein [Methanothrix sp.]